jgi:hypothetical protein
MADLQRDTETFVEAARWVAGVVGAIPDPVWDGPGLGEWDLRALVGHTSRAVLNVEQYLAAPATHEDVGSAAAYYERTASVHGADARAVLQRGVDAGAALGDDPAAAFHDIVERVTALLPGIDDRLVLTIAGGIRLSSYLPTRTFELAVHGLDIAEAAGVSTLPPERVLRDALDLATTLALQSGEGAGLLLALTGRRRLAPGFSVLRQ